LAGGFLAGALRGAAAFFGFGAGFGGSALASSNACAGGNGRGVRDGPVAPSSRGNDAGAHELLIRLLHRRRPRRLDGLLGHGEVAVVVLGVVVRVELVPV